jgi:hypothetical protein
MKEGRLTELVFTNEPNPAAPEPKLHHSGRPLLADKRPPLPPWFRPGVDDDIRLLRGERVMLLRGRGHPGTAGATMHGPRGLEVYIRLDQGGGAWFPLDEIGPLVEETPVAMQIPG